MDTPRLKGPGRVRIERDADRLDARIIVDGNDVSRNVTAVSWSMEAGQLPRATITFMAVEAENPETWTEAAPDREPDLDEYALYGSDTVDAMVTHTVAGCGWCKSFDDQPVTALLEAIRQHHTAAHAATRVELT